ncbi:hypothetical protein KDX30_01140 [Pseudomonas sp. CDFA 553]|uniref:hypothetical protein n=1 Tax=Pseudomonas quasicaspiana TaxID=2829821 RepID=UPI001E3C51CE|nr:hypothetical protein [Pseudomonas quasicaspiana]MCD5986495.1 hypothetical protein [Pseudomonas quasicaspiana]
MKFLLRNIRQGALCFLVTPVLMAILYVVTKMYGVTSETEVPNWLELIINWRYSARGFSSVFIGGLLICFAVTVLVKVKSMQRHNLNKFAKAFNLVGTFVSRNLYFWSGLFLAWSFGSRCIDFVQPISLQEVMVPLLVVMALVIEYMLLKFKHEVIRGKVSI